MKTICSKFIIFLYKIGLKDKVVNKYGITSYGRILDELAIMGTLA